MDPPSLVGVELARSARIELDKHLVALVVDVGGGVQGVLPDLVGRGELDVGHGGLDPLLLRPGGEGCGQDDTTRTLQQGQNTYGALPVVSDFFSLYLAFSSRSASGK